MDGGTTRRRRVTNFEKVVRIDITEAAATSPANDRKETVRAIAEQVLGQVSSKAFKIPMLPHAATEAMQIASDPGASIAVIGKVVAKDPLIAARVLAVANSSLYGNHAVRSLREALMRLGTGTIRDILYQAVAESHIFRGGEGRSLVAEREHAVAVAHVARCVCTSLGVESEFAFICGLLHDIGRPVLLETLKDIAGLEPDERTQVADQIHPVVGAQVAETWKLPKLVAEACRRHHVYRDWGGSGGYSQIGNIIAVADRIAEHHGLGRPQRGIDLSVDRCFFDLSLEPGEVMALVSQVADLPLAA